MPLPANTQGFQITEWGYQVQELFFRYGVLVLFSISLAIPPKRKIQLKTFSVFFLYLIIDSIFHGFDIQIRRTLLNISIGMLFYKIVVEYAERDLKKYATWIFWLIYANFVLAIFQYFDKDPIFSIPNRHFYPTFEISGFMKMKAALGELAAISTPFMMILSPLTALISLPLLWWSKSSSSALAFLASISFLLYFRVKKVWFFIGMAILVAAGVGYIVFFDMPGGQFGERLKVWHATLGHTLKFSPYFGYGLGKFSAWEPHTIQATQKDLLKWIWAHNEFVQIIFETGIIGFAIILTFIKQEMSKIFRYNHLFEFRCLFASFISILIISFFNFPFHLGRFVGISIFLMALYRIKASYFAGEGYED